MIVNVPGIHYPSLDYGSTLHFASVASDSGHDGDYADVFLNNPEVINDLAFRAIHVEAMIGKQIVEAYYDMPHTRSYYLGCSQGGRQGMHSALNFPEDFDGILAGAPAINFNHLTGAFFIWASFVGNLDPSSEYFISPELWETVSKEILQQCDGLDGIEDGMITEPEHCNFRPEALLCDSDVLAQIGPICATPKQVEALRKIYQPLIGKQGELIYPRFDPFAEADGQFASAFGKEVNADPKVTIFFQVRNLASNLITLGLVSIRCIQRPGPFFPEFRFE